MAVAEMEVS